MKLYIVRHGESVGNAGSLTQGNDEPLTEKGVRQAQFVAKRFKTIEVDVVLSSTANRAMETAKIIGDEIGKPIEHNSVFLEHQQATSTRKKLRTDEHVVAMRQSRKENYHTSGWRQEDEENFEDLRARGISAWDFISNRPESNILLVSHGFFIRMMVAISIMGEGLTSHEFWKFLLALFTRNTGITILESKPEDAPEDDPKWKLITWNDHAHLGEVDVT